MNILDIQLAFELCNAVEAFAFHPCGEEAVGFALGVADTGFLVGLRLVLHLGGEAARLGDELVAVGFGFVDDAALVLAGAGDVLEGRR